MNTPNANFGQEPVSDFLSGDSVTAAHVDGLTAALPVVETYVFKYIGERLGRDSKRSLERPTFIEGEKISEKDLLSGALSLINDIEAGENTDYPAGALADSKQGKTFQNAGMVLALFAAFDKETRGADAAYSEGYKYTERTVFADAADSLNLAFAIGKPSTYSREDSKGPATLAPETEMSTRIGSKGVNAEAIKWTAGAVDLKTGLERTTRDVVKAAFGDQVDDWEEKHLLSNALLIIKEKRDAIDFDQFDNTSMIEEMPTDTQTSVNATVFTDFKSKSAEKTRAKSARHSAKAGQREAKRIEKVDNRAEKRTLRYKRSRNLGRRAALSVRSAGNRAGSARDTAISFAHGIKDAMGVIDVSPARPVFTTPTPQNITSEITEPTIPAGQPAADSITAGINQLLDEEALREPTRQPSADDKPGEIVDPATAFLQSVKPRRG